MDIQAKLQGILDKKGWTRYKLSKESDINQATLTNIFYRNCTPTISTLERLCKSLGITLSEFFAEGDIIELTPELKEFYDLWVYLPQEKRRNIIETMKMMK